MAERESVGIVPPQERRRPVLNVEKSVDVHWVVSNGDDREVLDARVDGQYLGITYPGHKELRLTEEQVEATLMVGSEWLRTRREQR
jgi:hypothetical protein